MDADADENENYVDWDPKPTEDCLSEAWWLKSLKMKRVCFFYWHLRDLTPAPKW